MQVRFNVEMAVEIHEKNQLAYDTMKDMFKTEIELLYSQFSLISKRGVEVKFTITDDEHGEVIIGIFDNTNTELMEDHDD